MIYKDESAGIMFYSYVLHTWVYDVKFYLVGENWCTDMSGEHVVGKLTDQQRNRIAEFADIIAEREAVNANHDAFLKCRKRSCVCYKCGKHCNCAGCGGKKYASCPTEQLSGV